MLPGWMNANGLSKHASTFASHGIEMSHLEFITSADLRDMGITSVRERLEIMSTVNQWLSSRGSNKNFERNCSRDSRPVTGNSKGDLSYNSMDLKAQPQTTKAADHKGFDLSGGPKASPLAKSKLLRSLSMDSIPEEEIGDSDDSKYGLPSSPKVESSAPLSRRGSVAQNIGGSNESPRLSNASFVDDRAPILSSETSLRIRIGDYVRVKKTVTDPSYGWGAASHTSVGRVTGIKGPDCWVVWEYPKAESRPWAGKVEEMEPSKLPGGSGAFSQLAHRLGGAAGENTNEEMKEVILVGACALAKAVQWMGQGSAPFADVTLVAESGNGERIKISVHRAVLSAWSLPFRKMFTSKRFNKIRFGSEVPIPVANPSVFREFIRFMYIPVARLQKSNAIQMLQMADYWQVRELRSQCLRFIKATTTVNELPKVWEVAEGIYCHSLKRYCCEFAAKNIRECHENLSSSQLAAALARDDLGIADEKEVFEIIKKRIRTLRKTLEGDSKVRPESIEEDIVALLRSVRISNLPQGYYDVAELKGPNGRPKPAYMEALLQATGTSSSKERLGLRFTSVDEVQEKMYVRILSSVPDVAKLCYEKPPGAVSGPVRFGGPMASLCGKLVRVDKVEKRAGAVRICGALFPYTCLERVSAVEKERIEKELTTRELKEGELIDVLDQDNDWSPARVKAVSEEKGGKKEVLVSFLNQDSKWDILMPMSSHKIARLHEFSAKDDDGSDVVDRGEIHLELQQISKRITEHKGTLKQRDASRSVSDDKHWPPLGVDLSPLKVGSLTETPHAAVLMGEEVSWRRISQLANVKTAERISYPRFAVTEDADSSEGKMLAERKKALAEELEPFFQMGIRIRPKVQELWAGERREAKLVEGLSPKDAVMMKVLLASTEAHERRQARIDKSPDLIVSGSEEKQLNGVYRLISFQAHRPVFVNLAGARISFMGSKFLKGRWQLSTADYTKNHQWPGSKGFFPPLGSWSGGALTLSIAEVPSTIDDEKDRQKLPSTKSLFEQLCLLYASYESKEKVDHVTELLQRMHFSDDDLAKHVNVLGFARKELVAVLVDAIRGENPLSLDLGGDAATTQTRLMGLLSELLE